MIRLLTMIALMASVAIAQVPPIVPPIEPTLEPTEEPDGSVDDAISCRK